MIPASRQVLASIGKGLASARGWQCPAFQYIQIMKQMGRGDYITVKSGRNSAGARPAQPGGASPLAGLGANEAQVIKVVRREGRVHRSRISDLTGLQRSTLTALCNSLIARGLLHEQLAPPSGKRGKPRQMLSLSPEGGFAAGLSLSAERLRACLVDLCGTPRWEREVRLWDLSPEAVTREARSAIEEGFAELGWPMERFMGAGLSMPGHVERGSAIPVPLPQFMSWRGLHPGKVMSEALGLDVTYENDASSAALAEALFGEGRQHRSFLAIYCAHGVGGGLVLNGRLYRGINGNAGEIGAFYPRPLSRPSGDDLLAHLAKWGHRIARIDEIVLDETTRPAITAWVERAGNQLIEVIRAATYLLDPEAVFVGGLLPAPVAQLLVTRLRDSDVPLRERHPWPDIRLATFCGQGPHLGAAALPIDAALATDDEPELGY